MGYTQEFVDSLPPECLTMPKEFSEEDWLNDPNNLPFCARQENQLVFKAEEDFEFSERCKRGVLFDLKKQLYGVSFLETEDLYTENGENVEDLDFEELKLVNKFRNSKRYKPNPAQYQLWAWTAHALLNGDVTALNIRGVYKNSLDGADVSKIINKFGFWGLDEPIEPKKRLTLSRFAPLYSRIYNNDPRYTSEFPALKKLKENKELSQDFTVPRTVRYYEGSGHDLLVKDRDAPLKFCPDCGVITNPWRNIRVYPGDKEYDNYFQKVKKQAAKAKTERNAEPCQARYTEERYKFVKLGYCPD